MKFYKYWAQGEATVQRDGRPWKLRAYGGSNEGIGDAQRRAREVAERAAAAVERGRPPVSYGYADRPLREEIVEEISGANGPSAVITRNSYGALVLNTSRAMFVDVDDSPTGMRAGGGPPLGELLRNLWAGLRGKGSIAKSSRDEQTLGRFEDAVSSHPGMGLRIYRTAGGFRLLVTSATFDPMTAETNALLSAFGSDPLYTRLCKVQECFRARLSAKFWRCGAARPPSRFPWPGAAEEAEYRKWEQDYHRKANRYATCELVKTIGELTVHGEVEPILETHDRLTIRAGAPLA